ncbi:coiled-coil domain-containing protein 112-like [Babylonia areolata]|uniref:coiled-coil domain-containing protein 112-like n=1 Tax=Babylonia areolata TaxID=304850 RepID=UPI003FD22EB4
MATTSSQEGPQKQRDGADAARYKAEQQKKAEILREVHKLDIQIQAMERERATHIFSKRSDFRKDFSTLEEMNTKLTEERKEEQERMKLNLSKTGHLVKRFQRELTNIKPSPEFVERLKLIMEEIEGAINSFKEEQKQKYEELLRGERTLGQDLQALERKFETWTQTANDSAIVTHRSASTQRPLSTARDVTKDLPPEVAAFEKFLQQTGGHRGGWDEYDHGTFLRFRSRYKGRIVFLDHLKGAIPTKTEEEIREHETWYQEYLFLNEQKKDGIKIWRERREEEKEDLLTKAQTAEEEEEEEAERKRRIQTKIDEEKRERFSQLNSWKVQKELEKAMKEEKKLREELSKAKKLEEEKKRQTEIRAQVEEFRRQKEEEDQFIQQQMELRKRQEAEHRRQESAREIVRFRTRDLQKVHEKLSKEMEKENQLKEKEKQLERLKNKVQVNVDRDPTRLLQPTAGWKSRLKDTSSSGGGQVLHMPHRAVPNWRKN